MRADNLCSCALIGKCVSLILDEGYHVVARCGVSKLRLRIFDGSRRLFTAPASFLITITDGNRTQHVRDYFKSGETVFDLPFFNNHGDNYTVVAWTENPRRRLFQFAVLCNQSSRFLAVFLVIALWSSPGAALDDPRSIAQFAHTAWSAKDGVPSMIQALAQTKDGYLWLGTPGGLYRFDGVTFEHYSPEAGTKSANSNVTSLLALSDGDLWVGFAAGMISRLRDGSGTDYTSRDGVPAGEVRGLVRTVDGTIWAASTGGLLRLEANRWRMVGNDWNFPGKSADTIFLDHQGTLWVATGDTIVFLPSGTRTFRRTGIHVGLTLEQIAEAPNGKLWMTGFQRSSRTLPFPTPTVRPIPLGNSKPPSDRAKVPVGSHAILFDKEGTLWITTIGDGMRRVPLPDQLTGKPAHLSGAVEAFTSRDGLTNDFVHSILQDREGNIWVGTAGGLDRFRKTNLVPISLPIPAQTATLVAGDAGDLWVAGEGLLRVHGRRAVTVGEAATMEYILTGCHDHKGGIWWTAVPGFFHMLNGHFLRFAFPAFVKTDNWQTIQPTEDRSGTLWAAVEGAGLFYLSKNAWRRFDTPPDLAKLKPTAAFTDSLGRLWFGYENGSVIDLETKGRQTLLLRHDSQVGSVRTIQGSDQHIWIGGDFGLAFSNGVGFQKIIPSDSATFGSVSGIQETSDGSLWLAESRGVVHISGDEVRRRLSSSAHRVEYELFDSFDGLPGTFQNPVRGGREVQTSDGRLWFIATNGVAWINPTKIVKNYLPPPVSIRTVEANGERYDPRGTLALPALTSRLQISYTALSLTVPERVHFRYRLDGLDKDWEDVGTRREAFYTMLPPGRYRFRVIASNNDGVWNEQGATLNFEISRAWYQTIWFRLLCALLGITLCYALYLLRLRQYEAAMRMRFNERLEERTRIARELHDTLLQTIQGSKIVADHARISMSDPGKTQKLLNQLSDWLARATQEGRTALESLHAAEAGDLTAALRTIIEGYRATCDIELSLSVRGPSRDTAPLVRDEVYWIAHEAIRNACKHSGARHIITNLIYSKDLELSICDDGRGIPEDILREGRIGHFGLRGMRERASQIGVALTISSSAQKGTEVRLLVPGVKIFVSKRSRPFLPPR